MSNSKKENYIFVLFNSTIDAIYFEGAIADTDLSGRLVPVPSSISADCGMCWMEEAGNEKKIRVFIEKNKLEYSEIQMSQY